MIKLIFLVIISAIAMSSGIGASSASTVANTSSPCKYVDDKGATVFEKVCVVYYGSLMAIEGVRKCNWVFYTVHFTSKAKAEVWITEDDGCQSTINGISTKVELGAYGKYNYVFLTEEGEIFYLGFDEDQ